MNTIITEQFKQVVLDYAKNYWSKKINADAITDIRISMPFISITLTDKVTLAMQISNIEKYYEENKEYYKENMREKLREQAESSARLAAKLYDQLFE